MTGYALLIIKGSVRHIAEVGLEGWARLEFLCGGRAGGRVMGKSY